MKKILSLVLLLSLFSCDKDESNTLSAKYSKQEIFNAVIGTWKFSRLGYNPEFKKIENVTYEECGRNNYTIFGKDSSLICIRDCGRDELIEKGTFYVEIGGNTPEDKDIHIRTQIGGIILKPSIAYAGAILYHFTDTTLIFTIKEFPGAGETKILYSELQRVK